jgi:cephalosporin hydroxylase
MNRTLKRRIQLLESRVGAVQDCHAVLLEETLAELRRIEQWLAARGYSTAEEALQNGEKGPPEGWRWGSLPEIAKIEQLSERLRQQAWAEIHKTAPSSEHDMV